MKKLPEITLVFWIMKIAATTLGETGGDLLAQTMGVGYAVSSVVLFTVFLASLAAQLCVKRFHPVLYWTVILSTSTAGTTMSDFMNRTAGLGYLRGALVLISALGAVFAVWRFSGRPFDVTRVTDLRGESLYWTAILFSNTLGTSLGDFLADDTRLGFGGGATVIGGLMILIVLARYCTPVSVTLLFWVAFVLTRPLGATTGDLFSKPVAKGGLGYGTIGASLILTTVLLILIAYQARRGRVRRPRGSVATPS
ncbi:COG4705 family protein [Spirillospora sp. CA-128828]|uniref:COG4705 family protein n=1 Tax=Spirillospora sp. CA-128828 TaxID=3240033 RepID=UPI003D8B106E